MISTPIPSPVTLLGGQPTVKTTDALLVSIIDRSGSMGAEIAAARQGYNTLVADQAKLPGCLVSTVIFDDRIDVLQVAAPAADSIKLDETNCTARGSTALFDAVATGINGATLWLTNNPTFKGRVIVSVFTDGGENASTEYPQRNALPQSGSIFPTEGNGLARLNALINAKKAEGWEFLFLGSGESAWLQGRAFASSVGAQHTYTVNNNTAGTYAGASQSFLTARQFGSAVADTLRSNLAANNALVAEESEEQ